MRTAPTRGWNPERLCPLALVFLLTWAPITPAAEARTESEPAGKNAAFYYWQAAALLRRPDSVQELEVLQFIENELEVLPASALLMEPEALRWLIAEAPALKALSRATQLSECRFGVTEPNSPRVELLHLPTIRSLADRALQSAKAYQFANNDTGAARIYVSIYRLVEHLNQDQALTSGLLGANTIQMCLLEIARFTSRKPHSSATSALVDYFGRAPDRVLRVGDYLRAESERYANWLLEDPGDAESRLAALYGDIRNTPAVDRLLTLGEEEKRVQLKRWVDGYRAQMTALAEAVDKSHPLGIYIVRELDQEKAAAKKAPLAAEMNPLLPLLVPTMEKTYERLLLAEAHFRMAEILCAAALYRVEINEWPESLDAIETYVNRSFLRDPFSGETMHYKLSRDMPQVTARVPRWIARNDDLVYTVELADRKAKDETLFKEFQEAKAAQERKERLRQKND